MGLGVVMGARRNTALWAQAVVGAIVASFSGSTLVAPFSTLSALLGVALTAAVAIAGLAFTFECLMLPFAASALRVPVPRVVLPWVALGLLGSLSVISGIVGHGIPGDLAIKLMRVGVPAAFIGSAVVFLRSRRAP